MAYAVGRRAPLSATAGAHLAPGRPPDGIPRRWPVRVSGWGSALCDVPLAVDPDGLEARHDLGGDGRLGGDALEGGVVPGHGCPADLQALEGGSQLLDLVEHRGDRRATGRGGARD